MSQPPAPETIQRSTVMFENPNAIQISQSTLWNVGGDSHIHYANKTSLHALHKHVATGAFHNSAERFDPPKCHPRTRIAILDHIQNWYKNRDVSSPRLMWLYGPAGAGKSAIAQTTAEICQGLGTLAACFFFSRTAPGRDGSARLIVTITYQIALAIPTTIPHIQRTLERDPLIFSKSMDTQLRHLIIDPILAIIPNKILDRKLIIIDGLDECNDKTAQSNIVRCFASAVMDRDLQLSVLISSRPEQPIRDAFSGLRQCGEYVSTVLGEDYADNEDVERYLRDSFEEIRSTHTMKRYIPETWPQDRDIQTLVQKSSGQFIFASTVIRYVRSLHHRPMDRLREVLAVRTAPHQDTSPFEELDVLYMHILRSVNNVHRPMILQFFGYLLFGHDAAIFEATNTIEILLGFRPGDLELALMDCHSIIEIIEHSDNTKSAQFFHASILDFFIDCSRSREFFLDGGIVHARLCWACMAGALSPVATVRSYSSRALNYHTQNAHMDETLLLALLSFDFSYIFDLRNTLDGAHFDVVWRQLRWLQQQVHDRPSDVKEDLLQRQMRAIKSLMKRKFFSYEQYQCESFVEFYALAEIIPEHYRIYTKSLIGLGRIPGHYEGLRRLPISDTREDMVQLYTFFLHDQEFAEQYHINSDVYASLALKCIKSMLSSYDTVDLWHRHRGDKIHEIGQQVLPSILSSAAPNHALADILGRMFEDQDWTSAQTLNSAGTKYLERYETWKAQHWQGQRTYARWD